MSALRTVIVADDEALIRWALRERLAQDGFGVVEAADGQSALRSLDRASSPVVMLLDLKLPDTSGLAVLSEVRSRRPEVPVVIMTAYWASDAAAEAVRLGASSSLSKPLNLDRVATLVSQLMPSADGRLTAPRPS